MSSSCLLPFWVPRRQMHFISVFLKVTFAPAHTFCKYRAWFHITQGRGTGKSSEELLLLQHYTEIHSLCVLTNHTTQKFFSAFSYCDPFWTSRILQENKIKCYLQEGFEPFSWTLCVCVKVFSCFFPSCLCPLIMSYLWLHRYDAFTGTTRIVQKFRSSTFQMVQKQEVVQPTGAGRSTWNFRHA